MAGNDNWGFTGYGGGSAMFWPAVSPHDPDYDVACDMTGSRVTYNGGKSWRMFSLRGPVKYFVIDPVDPDVAYAKSIALFKSTDRGRTPHYLPCPLLKLREWFQRRGPCKEERIITIDRHG